VLDSAEEKLSDHFETAFGFIEQGVAAGKTRDFLWGFMFCALTISLFVPVLMPSRRDRHSRALLRWKIAQCVRCALHALHSRVLNTWL
jgi:hypothetical protein